MLDEMFSTYEVRLPAFEGPLDLLLHLIERNELDITAISLAQVTDQYIEYTRRLEQLSAANLADFLVVASKLLLIKSRMLLPSTKAKRDEDEEEVGQDLVRQLIEYKKFKAAAASLAARHEQGLRAVPRPTNSIPVNRALDTGDLTIDALMQAVRRALNVTPPAPPLSTVMSDPGVTLGEKIADIRLRLEGVAEIDFEGLISESRHRVEIIVTFLAVLELIKANALTVEQTGLFGRIVLRRKAERPEPVEETIE